MRSFSGLGEINDYSKPIIIAEACENHLGDINVAIKMIKNAKEALLETENGIIELQAGINKQGRTEVCVKDNGPGIPSELMDEIFVPFFTTREHGSGIGLSLSRQIMRLHGGGLSVLSKPNEQTTFCLKF